MPSVLRSRLPALAVAACAFACLTGAGHETTSAALAGRGQAARERLGPPVPPRRVVERIRPKPTLGERAVRVALDAVGAPYRWGGASPSSGFDCSGLVEWAYGRVGVQLPHSSYALAGLGHRVRPSRLRPGDLLFFYGFGHVGLYAGRGLMVHAPRSGRTVEVVRLGASGYGSALVAARRVAHA